MQPPLRAAAAQWVACLHRCCRNLTRAEHTLPSVNTLTAPAVHTLPHSRTPVPPPTRLSGAGVSGLSKPSAKRLRVNVSKVKEEMVADGLDSAGGYEYLRQPTDLVVLGKVRLTPAARDIQVRGAQRDHGAVRRGEGGTAGPWGGEEGGACGVGVL